MPIDSELVADKCYRGLFKAHERYETWSGWWWRPPECLALYEIADAVHRLEKVYWVTPEFSVRETLSEARVGKGRPPKVLPKQGRFDIVVWNSRNPEGVIEVKTRGDTSPLEKDVERVCNAISRTTGIRWGVVAFMCARDDVESKSGKDRVRERLDKLSATAQTVAERRGVKFVQSRRSRPRIRKGGAVAVGVFVFGR